MATDGGDASTEGILPSKISPHYLHSNSTSHPWVFSAFAEIIDNAYDPDVRADDLFIEPVEFNGETCLMFLDNGAGMDKHKLHKMLSFGFCDKALFDVRGKYLAIGHYGNGFKSGSMRIGNDALVFTRTSAGACIGFLSQTFLLRTNAESVIVPILEYSLPEMEREDSPTAYNNLKPILDYSIFKTEDELKEQLKSIATEKRRSLRESRSMGLCGTKIIIFNLKKLKNGRLELDFKSDPKDIRCPEAFEADTTINGRPVEQFVSPHKTSLREYSSILFFKPRMRIFIQGHKVVTKYLSKILEAKFHDSYKPKSSVHSIRIAFGKMPGTDRSDDYGLMLYHRNRLILAYKRVGCQMQGIGQGVVGVAEVNYLQPTHNKQGFNEDGMYNSLIKAFSQKLKDYCSDVDDGAEFAQENKDKFTWILCDQCKKWRRLPVGIDADKFKSEEWFCRMNPDQMFNRCEIEEEPEEEEKRPRRQSKGIGRQSQKRKGCDGSTPSKRSKNFTNTGNSSSSRRFSSDIVQGTQSVIDSLDETMASLMEVTETKESDSVINQSVMSSRQPTLSSFGFSSQQGATAEASSSENENDFIAQNERCPVSLSVSDLVNDMGSSIESNGDAKRSSDETRKQNLYSEMATSNLNTGRDLEDSESEGNVCKSSSSDVNEVGGMQKLKKKPRKASELSEGATHSDETRKQNLDTEMATSNLNTRRELEDSELEGDVCISSSSDINEVGDMQKLNRKPRKALELREGATTAHVDSNILDMVKLRCELAKTKKSLRESEETLKETLNLYGDSQKKLEETQFLLEECQTSLQEAQRSLMEKDAKIKCLERRKI